ncbi:hypothetical protein BMF94_5756 [Rhodotorula taiwanensis]|uniref:Btz domain-containing protein n=1 Tax=Rhodotorula taiwanensis TaxID=741276 RepID=A0A2S5B3S9_9BASI|nr:hypothetical protein BMF94_5756 [Rhodotorula taiwanensis]
MSVRPADLSPPRNGSAGENVAPPPPAHEPSKPGQLASIGASGQPRKRVPNKAPRRTVVRRRGARVDSESENDDDTARSTTVASSRVRRASDSDSDLDLDPPSSSDDDDDDDGAVEPRTPATASVEQLPTTADTSTPRHPLKSRKAVLAGQGLHPSWADMPAPGEDGDTSLPTLDFSNLSLDVVQHLPPPGPKPRPSPVAAKATLAGEQLLSTKQLKDQRRQAKLATLAAKDPQAADRLAKEREEREAAKRLAKKERQKAKKKERKLLLKSSGSGDLVAGTDSADDTKPVSPAAPSPSTIPPPTADLSVPIKDAKASKASKKAQTPVPSRPSRTAVALGLGNADNASPASTTSSALPSMASATTPVVPSAQRQPAFLPRDPQGRPVPQNEAPPPSRSRRAFQAAEGTTEHWTRGRGGSVRGFGSYRGRETGRYGAHERDDHVAENADDAWAADASQRGEGLVRGRGRGRGRGSLAGRGRVTGPPGAINPRYAHLPFHPLHRFPAPAGTAQADAQTTPKRSDTRPIEPSGPKVTTAASEEQLFAPTQATPRARSRQDDNVVKSPESSGQQLSITVKGAASAARASTPRPSSGQARPANADTELAQGSNQLYLSDPGILYASAPTLTETAPRDKAAEAEAGDRHESLASLQQVPPHLQDGPSPESQPTGTVYYQQQPQFPLAFWSTGNGEGEQYPISTPPPPVPASVSPPPFGTAVAHPPPSSAYFVPPRPSRRVEIKPPSSRDGQSPAPSSSAKTAPQPPVDALEAARGIRDAQLLQQQEHQRQAEAAYMQAASYGFAAQAHFPPPPPPMSNLPASPTIGRPPQHVRAADFARDAFPIPANAPLPAPHVAHQPAPMPQQMYSPYQQIPPTTYELVAPYPSYYPAAAAYYAPQPMYQQTFSHPPNGAVGYVGMYAPQQPTQDAHPVAFDDSHRQWQGY